MHKCRNCTGLDWAVYLRGLEVMEQRGGQRTQNRRVADLRVSRVHHLRAVCSEVQSDDAEAEAEGQRAIDGSIGSDRIESLERTCRI